MVWQSETQEIAVIGVYIDVVDGVAPAAVTSIERRGRFSRARDVHMQKRQNGTVAATPGAPTALLETIFSVVDSIATPGTKVETPPLVMSEVIDIVKAGSFQGYVFSKLNLERIDG